MNNVNKLKAFNSMAQAKVFKKSNQINGVLNFLRKWTVLAYL